MRSPAHRTLEATGPSAGSESEAAAPSAHDDTVSVTRVLIVDDDPDISSLLRVRLAAGEYQVDVAADGEEALARVETIRPDLMFLDVWMPGIDGLEVLDQVRDRGLDMAIIMTTAFGSEEVAVEALRRGADDYLRKPFEAVEFRAVLERTVARLQLSRQNAVLRRKLDEKRRQLEAELARAGQVQAELLELDVPVLDGFELAARCVPARDVGGDYYSWHQPSPGILKLTVGDVMGKGMSAALLMATVRAAVHAVSRQNPPAAALDLAARALERDLERSGSFVTLFHVQLEVAARRLTYVDAGHGHVFVRRADGTSVKLEPRGLPLGVLPECVYQEGAITLGQGDALVVYSDGLIDARPDVTIDALMIARQLDGATSAEDMVSKLIDLAALSGPPPDDLTAVVLRCREE